MNNLRAPYITFAIGEKKQKLTKGDHRTLLILPGTETKLYENIDSLYEQKEKRHIKFYNLIVNTFKRHNLKSPLEIFTIKMLSNKDSKSKIKINGTAKKDFKLNFFIGDENHFSSHIPIEINDNIDSILKKLKEHFNGDFNFEKKANEIEITPLMLSSIFNGSCPGVKNDNLHGLEIETFPFSGGNESLENLKLKDFEDLLKGRKYDSIVFHDFTLQELIVNLLEKRFVSRNEVLGGSALTILDGPLNDIIKKVEPLNSRFLTVFGSPAEMRYNCMNFLLLLEICAKRALRLTQDSNISHLVIDPIESYGGPEKASLPYHNTPISYKNSKGYLTLPDLERANDAGVSLLVNGYSNAVLSFVLTTYKVNKAGFKDTTYKYLNAVDATLLCQDYIFNNFKNKFSQTRFSDGIVDNSKFSITNQFLMKDYLITLHKDLINMALVQGSDSNIKAFEKSIIIESDAANGKVDINFQLILVSQLRIVNGIIEIGFSL